MRKYEHRSKWPWQVDVMADGDGNKLVRIFSSERNCSCVCTMMTNQIGAGTRAMADARLIAAAPELYECLKTACAECRVENSLEESDCKECRIHRVLARVNGENEQ